MSTCYQFFWVGVELLGHIIFLFNVLKSFQTIFFPFLSPLNIFIYLFSFLAGPGLLCCAWAFPSCGEWGLLLEAVRGLLIAVVSPVSGAQSPVASTRRLSSYGSWALELSLSSCSS